MKNKLFYPDVNLSHFKDRENAAVLRGDSSMFTK
jgi:hypothetical protein